jgi:D-3-phosphoglycerate dehydrogenase
MSDTIEPLIFDLVAWVAKEERSYAEVMDAWRTSCPRLPIWEEANARGFLTRSRNSHGDAIVCVTLTGREFLAKSR